MPRCFFFLFKRPLAPTHTDTHTQTFCLLNNIRANQVKVIQIRIAKQMPAIKKDRDTYHRLQIHMNSLFYSTENWKKKKFKYYISNRTELTHLFGFDVSMYLFFISRNIFVVDLSLWVWYAMQKNHWCLRFINDLKGSFPWIVSLLNNWV